MSFEWRTEEESGWQEGARPDDTAVSQPFWRRRWRFLLGVLLGITAVWLVVQWQISQRVQSATATLEDELLATHNFVLQTAVRQDETLFRANLSGRDPAWTEAQKTLLDEGLLLGRPMLSWQHQPAAARLTPDEVTFVLDPDLLGAELLYPQTYAIQTTPGVTTTFTLQQTAVYRQGSSRWLYSPPDADFWGEWTIWPGHHLTLAYPGRDTAVAQRLGQDLDALLGQMCTALADLNCPTRLRVNLRLDTDPDSLLALNDPNAMMQGGLRLELPTPTLVGLPTDEASYDLLVRAYGVQLATAVLTHQTAYDCCRHPFFFHALLDYQLAQLDLQPWPLTEASYSHMLALNVDGDLTRYWNRRWSAAQPQTLQVWVVEDPNLIWQQVYMLVEFLAEQEAAVSPSAMMRFLDSSGYDLWLAEVLGRSYEESELKTRFLAYVYEQSHAGQAAAPPIPLPEGTITVVCYNFAERPGGKVYDYDLAGDTWTERFAGSFTDAHIRTMDGQHFIVTEFGYKEPYNSYKVSLVTEDGGVQLLEDVEIIAQNEHWIDYAFVDETAAYLLRSEHVEGEFSTHLQPTDCATGDCPPVPIHGWPLFSPNQEHLIVRVPPSALTNIGDNVPYELQHVLYLMTPDGQERRLFGRGGLPFWLNDETFAFQQMSKEGWELVIGRASGGSPHFLLSQADVLLEFPADDRPDGLFLNQVVVNPVDSQELLLQLRRAEAHEGYIGYGPNTPSYLFKVTLTADFTAVEQIKLLRQDSFTGPISFAADGRYIRQGDYGYSTTDMTWYFLNPDSGEPEYAFASIDRLAESADGQWHIQYHPNFLMLHAPAHNYQYFIPHNLGECQQVILSSAE
ncbi:MAG: hypothetical protein IPM53_09505 [Anaerolineaceae bacterium]|nr:hypothetical protein [Anaerolineaceae bacterium]